MRAHRTLWMVGVCLALVVVMAGSALATSTDVSIQSFAFNPKSAHARMGDTVRWTNNDGPTHTTTSDGSPCCPFGPDLWDSGPLVTGDTFSFVFTTAGKYLYHCAFHQFMKGSIVIGMRAVPSTGTQSTQFTITWARGSIPAGYNMDIQIKRPGVPFADWKLDQAGTTVSTTFTPDGGTGTYAFRARLQLGTDDQKVSGYSPNRSISVT
jgi:plastocyanin